MEKQVKVAGDDKVTGGVKATGDDKVTGGVKAWEQATQEKMQVIAKAGYATDEKLLAMATDTTSTVADVKSTLYDMAIAKETSVIAGISSDNVSEKVDAVDGATSDEEAKLEDKQGEAYLAYAKENEGSIS